MNNLRGTYLHAPWLVNRKTGGAEFAAAYVASDCPWSFFHRRRGWSTRTVRFRFRLLNDRFVDLVLAFIATKVQTNGLLNGLRHHVLQLRGTVLRLLASFWMTVKSFRLVRLPATFARLGSALRRRGYEHFQIILYRRP